MNRLKISTIKLLSTISRKVLGEPVSLTSGVYDIFIRLNPTTSKPDGFTINKKHDKTCVTKVETVKAENIAFAGVCINDPNSLFGDDYYLENGVYYNIWHEVLDIKYSKDDDSVASYTALIVRNSDNGEVIQISVF